MKRVLFVSNGHGEVAIAARIARDLPGGVAADHLALVAVEAPQESAPLNDVGPRKSLPSGGLVAMGNFRNIARDVRAGLPGLTIAQRRFLRAARGEYDAAVAVGDTYALAMTLAARTRTIFVGTAKSVYVAPYGFFERRIIARAARVFVRDEATAASLRARGIEAQSANVIADLYAGEDGAAGTAGACTFDPKVALFPGSRESAYADALKVCAVLREVARDFPRCGALLSVAPAVDADRLAAMLSGDGWDVRRGTLADAPFSLWIGEREIVRSQRGSLAPVLRDAAIVIGQAGTANEGAAALGIPVVALVSGKPSWYRRRQIALLDGAMETADPDPRVAAATVRRLLGDPDARGRMAAIGRSRMGPPGASARVAAEIVRLCA